MRRLYHVEAWQCLRARDHAPLTPSKTYGAMRQILECLTTREDMGRARGAEMPTHKLGYRHESKVPAGGCGGKKERRLGRGDSDSLIPWSWFSRRPHRVTRHSCDLCVCSASSSFVILHSAENRFMSHSPPALLQQSRHPRTLVLQAPVCCHASLCDSVHTYPLFASSANFWRYARVCACASRGAVRHLRPATQCT